MSAAKVREDRLRRMARRQKLTLRKSGRRDTRAYDYGVYALVDEHDFQQYTSRSLDDIERWLTSR